MEEKSKGLTKKNLYLLLLSIAIVVIAITVTVAIATNNATVDQIEAPKSSSTSTSKTSVSNSVSTSTSNPSSSVPPSSSEDDKPTVMPITFVNPVENGYLMTEYTQAGLIYNQTLGLYEGHMGIDIAGSENANVFSAYDGEILAITTTYLKGTTIEIDHGEGLTTIYNSIEPIDGLEVGAEVSAGDIIGIVSTNNRQEYKNGAHLHFEVKENGKNIDPYKYLDIDSK